MRSVPLGFIEDTKMRWELACIVADCTVTSVLFVVVFNLNFFSKASASVGSSCFFSCWHSLSFYVKKKRIEKKYCSVLC